MPCRQKMRKYAINSQMTIREKSSLHEFKYLKLFTEIQITKIHWNVLDL